MRLLSLALILNAKAAMILETSCGIIPLRHVKEGWQVFLVQLHAGHWSFPKGHANLNETQHATAERELHEETGLRVKRYLSDTPVEEKYYFQREGNRIHKTVFFFVAEVQGRVRLQQQEIRAGEWLSITAGVERLTFSLDKALLERTSHLIS